MVSFQSVHEFRTIPRLLFHYKPTKAHPFKRLLLGCCHCYRQQYIMYYSMMIGYSMIIMIIPSAGCIIAVVNSFQLNLSSPSPSSINNVFNTRHQLFRKNHPRRNNARHRHPPPLLFQSSIPRDSNNDNSDYYQSQSQQQASQSQQSPLTTTTTNAAALLISNEEGNDAMTSAAGAGGGEEGAKNYYHYYDPNNNNVASEYNPVATATADDVATVDGRTEIVDCFGVLRENDPAEGRVDRVVRRSSSNDDINPTDNVDDYDDDIDNYYSATADMTTFAVGITAEFVNQIGVNDNVYDDNYENKYNNNNNNDNDDDDNNDNDDDNNDNNNAAENTTPPPDIDMDDIQIAIDALITMDIPHEVLLNMNGEPVEVIVPNNGVVAVTTDAGVDEEDSNNEEKVDQPPLPTILLPGGNSNKATIACTDDNDAIIETKEYDLPINNNNKDEDNNNNNDNISNNNKLVRMLRRQAPRYSDVISDEREKEESERAVANSRKWSEWMVSGRKVWNNNNNNDNVIVVENSLPFSSSSATTTSAIPPLESIPLESSMSSSTTETSTILEGGTNGETIIQSEDLPMKTVMTSSLKSTSLDGVVAAVESSSTIELRSDESAIPTPSDVVVVVTTDRIATGGSVGSLKKVKKKNLLMEILETFTQGYGGFVISRFVKRIQQNQRFKVGAGAGNDDNNNDKSKLTQQTSKVKTWRTPRIREPGRISAGDWRDNVINLPNSTILRDVRDPITWLFIWSTSYSIVYECLTRLVISVTKGVDCTVAGRWWWWGGSTTITEPGWVHVADWVSRSMCLPTLTHSMMVSAMSLLLVFRTNSAYQRFAEGRKIWNDIVDTARDFSRMIKLYETAIGTSRCRRINSLLASFPYLLRHRIRPSLMTFYRVNDSKIERDPEHSLLLYPDESLVDTDVEVAWLAYDEEYETGSTRRKTRELCWVDKRTLPWKLIPGSALEPCARAQNRPLWVCDRMAKEIVVVDDMGTSFTNRERGKLIEFVEKLSRSIGACERIHQTSVPLNYARHALRSLTVWLWTLPAVLVKDLGLLTGPVVAVLSWILFGVYEIGSRIEDPFQGTLRLSVYCDAIRRDVLADAIQRDTAFILEGEEGKSLVDVEGEEDAVFELESESEEYDGDDVLPIKKKKTKKPQKSWFPGL